jgi:hypothetical protein
MVSSLGALIGPLFDAGESPAQDKKRAAKPKAKVNKKKGTAEYKTTKGEGSVTEPMQQHGELASAKEPVMPTATEQTHDHARRAKVYATQDWVEGRMTSKDHKTVHDRANHVLMNRKPKDFKGITGEKAVKGRRGAW